MEYWADAPLKMEKPGWDPDFADKAYWEVMKDNRPDVNVSHVEGKSCSSCIVLKFPWRLITIYMNLDLSNTISRGFIQRRMRKHLESLEKVLQKSGIGEDEQNKKGQLAKDAST
ncbi:hypothetical protein NE237_014402 [Protea cynaroides]|uniref:Uncharacterized protein n=1 Tax=Protea cynaroides TaxID=273540 RepID=A0A9Q0KC90_9MAGN|nr:hypothetical protein NE237_014402 [Protea cynaroides]